MAEGERVTAELTDFRRRVDELRAARALPSTERLSVLDAALLELQHVVDVILPRLERGLPAERDNGARRAADEQQLLRALFQRMPYAVALLGPDTVIRRLNFAGTRLFGMRAGYAAGRPLTASLAPEARAAFRSQIAAVSRNEGDRSLVVRLLPPPDGARREGESLRATMTALRPRGETGTSVLTVFLTGPEALAADRDGRAGRDGAGRTGTPPGLAELTRTTELMDLLDDMTMTILEAPRDPIAILDQACRVLRGRFADWVTADLVTRGGGPLVRVAAYGGAGPDAAHDGKDAHDGDGADALQAALASQPPGDCPVVVEAARAGNAHLQVRPEDLEAFGHDADGVPILARAGVTSLLCVPLRARSGPVRGVLTLLRTGGRRAFSMAEAGTVDRMARHLGRALRP
ncbi:GAF domain-containing protein [Streptomyces albofaciens JCM 4342]|uniref:PAS domain-containing protein n=1 Tax=Streptomyces albofaciens TaxID=66866 RepID=UPI00123C468A|nr:PAS domain-containing protein [Streptomyces albofaciens]KAA6213040.1 GAF domain-containing protein [Streptomyces albofaciens JCM 4342]